MKWAVEKDAKCREVLSRHWPGLEIHEDVIAVGRENLVPVDIVCGGSPCQSFSVAGLRKGLADNRGNLAFEFCRICDEIDPDTIIYENVPGLLSSHDNAFGCLLGALVGSDTPLVPPGKRGRWTSAGMAAGPKRALAWRILDAQYFGVAQRRRRVFVVASPRAERPSQILFDTKGMSGDSPPRRETGQGDRRAFAPGSFGGWRAGLPTLRASGGGISGGKGNLVADVAGPITNRYHKGVNTTMDDGALVVHLPDVTHTLRGVESFASEDGTGRGTPIIPTYAQPIPFDMTQVTSVANRQRFEAGNPSPTLHQAGGAHIIEAQSIGENARGEVRTADVMRSLTSGGGKPGQGYPAAITPDMQVRRLTPIECERLQGFPDNWTKWDTQGREISDSQRYKMCGNAVAAPVVYWIAKRVVEWQSNETTGTSTGHTSSI